MGKKNSINIYKKLHAVMAEVGTLEKDKTNEMQNYQYLSEMQVKQAIQPLLVKNGLLFYVDIKKTKSKAIYKTKTGNDMYLTKTRLEYHFVDVDTGKKLSGVFEGHGTDTGDKAIYKGITGAIKYILTSTFLIPTGDDPENEKTRKITNKLDYETSPAATEKQKKLIFALAKQKGVEQEKIKEGYKLLSWSEMTISQASKIIDQLNSKPDIEIVTAEDLPDNF